MDRNAVAIVLDEIATLLDIQGENRFKVGAFSRAARAIEQSADDLTTLLREDRLQSIPGIGPATAGVIAELVNTGASRYYDRLRESTPDGLLELLSVPRLGASRIRTLHEKLGIASLNDLERAAREGRIASLPGFGARTEARILEGITDVRGVAGRRRYADALELGERMLAFATALPAVTRASLAGELRRGCETVAGIEILAEAEPSAAQDALASFAQLPVNAKVHDSAAAGRLADGFQVQFSCVPAAEYATNLLFATGSAEHIERLVAAASELQFELTAAGLFKDGSRIATPEEADVYRTLGLDFIQPELRETGLEIDAARSGSLPSLVTYPNLRGCFHCHTTWSDGKNSVAEMAQAAKERGWRYLGIADHSQFAGYAGGLSPDEILAQHAEIDEWNEQHGREVWVFKGMEADILASGQLDYHDRPDLLERFDYVIGSIHSSFGLSRDEQTRRLLRAIQNPFITFLGHLTGRLLLARRGCDLDLAAVLQAVAERDIAIEINSDPNRMELDWRHWPSAKQLGIPTAINPDAHSIGQLDYVYNGVNIARKGWLEPGDIINCGTLTQVKAYFKRARKTD